jgi:hypothetical protein
MINAVVRCFILDSKPSLTYTSPLREDNLFFIITFIGQCKVR